MKLSDVRAGNIVKESSFSSRDRALQPFYRVEYRDLGYSQFMEGIPITLEWCKYLKMDTEIVIPSSTTRTNFDWIAEAPNVRIIEYNKEITVYHGMCGVRTIMEHIKYVHQLQNFYYGYWGFEIDEVNPTEFYKEPNE